jgi:hypothetical protein
MTLHVLSDKVDDEYTKQSLKRIERYINNQPMERSHFIFLDLSVTSKTYPYTTKIPHSLGFAPMDVITTYVTGGTVTWLYEQFTDTDIVFTVSAATRVRFFVGRYEA